MEDQLKLSERQQEIVEAALELLAEKGYDELSIRDIGKKLDVKAPAIYWHFKNKAMIVDYMAEHILQKKMGNFVPREREQSWQDWLIEHIALFRKAMLSYPDGGRVIAGAHPFPHGTLAKFLEVSFASLRSAGMDIRTARIVMLTVIRYTFGCVMEEQADEQSWETLPERTINSGELTNIMEAINVGGTDDENFMTGLKLIVAGGNEAMASDNFF
ncbi:TetR family transcriptional regulator [Paenibacillus sp. UNC499MF]|uniref:TetR family transcriptional regulator n=1 Tax=Paenibacillus sp. UNC499MF TaxID=1502751 RepID=UPI0008A00177|nr:TetR family transcriptional regulator [Paenibacillus sp. UNC499MF]SEF65348.1 transcriptional regulator, TetR family [Paenibacillus sp. UNC499MF]